MIASEAEQSTTQTWHDRAVVYVTDQGFLVPTVVSALQVKAQVGDVADVVVALTEISADKLEPLFRLGKRLGLIFCTVPQAEIEGATFRKAHVPVASLARLLLPEVLDPRYRQVVYLDGDTQIQGDIRPLVMFDTPPGKVAAAPDALWLGFATRKRFPATYLQGLGVTSPQDYFNAGVMALERGTLDTMFPKALQFFRENSIACLYHDQSALNAVFAGNRVRLSPRYNFISDYSFLGLIEEAKPVLVHFTGPTKPWLHAGFPWGGRFLSSYMEVVEANPELRPFAKIYDHEKGQKIANRINQTRRRYRLMWPITWARRHRFRKGVGQGLLQ